ncbi:MULTISPECIES: toprim domain-containing protein [Pseudomonas]|uniref:toprim domain-containing protein n=1 Tax=Pseudomonas TaxID=286 RepID=UPI001F3DD2AF|nr:toprim domain-containing protein [Pseudomonas juntendi]
MTTFQQRTPALAGSACTEKVDAIRQVAAFAQRYAPALVAELLPEGKRQGNEWWAKNPARADRNAGSFSVSLKDGRWNDFASGDRGGDLVSLAAFVLNVSQSNAAAWVARRLGLDIPALDGRAGPPPADLQKQLERVTRETEAKAADYIRQVQARQQEVAEQAAQLWSSASRPDPDHAYLVRKQIAPWMIRQRGSELLVPLYADGYLVNLQRIALDGQKRFLAGARVKGAYCPIGKPVAGGRLYVAEGWATACTVYQLTGCPVAAAMNAGNLKPVALAMKAKYPDAQLVIAGDDDRQTEGNPGRTAAMAAAVAAGAEVSFPEWPDDAPLALTDFNDLHVWGADHE